MRPCFLSNFIILDQWSRRFIIYLRVSKYAAFIVIIEYVVDFLSALRLSIHFNLIPLRVPEKKTDRQTDKEVIVQGFFLRYRILKIAGVIATAFGTSIGITLSYKGIWGVQCSFVCVIWIYLLPGERRTFFLLQKRLRKSVLNNI